ncbi:MAG: hypothetical protein AAGF11_38005 [Myxococcota bacterium]
MHRYRIFAFFWAAATFAGLVHRTDLLTTPICTAVTCLAILTMFRPSWTWPFLGMNGVQIYHYFVHAPPPGVGNQDMFRLVAQLAIMIAFFVAARRHGVLWGERSIEDGEFRERFLASFAPALRALTVLLYFFAVFHKLNTDYFDPSRSCGGYFTLWFLEGWPNSLPDYGVSPGTSGKVLLPEGPTWFKLVSLYGLLVAETAIPILLVMRRTVFAGIGLGLALHIFVGFFNYWHFSVILYPLYALFLPARSIDDLAAWAAGIRRRWGPRQRALTGNGVMALIFALIPILVLAMDESAVIRRQFGTFGRGGNWRGPQLTFQTIAGWGMFLVLSITTVVALVRLIRRERQRVRAGEGQPSQPLFARSLAVAFALCAGFFNGFTPYLGLKTDQAWTMFAGLYTEAGSSNHFIMPSWQPFDLQQDLVRPISSSDNIKIPGWKSRYLVNYYTLRYYVSRQAARGVEDISVSYTRDGVRYDIENAEAHPELAAPIGFGPRKFLSFKKIPADPEARKCWY